MPTTALSQLATDFSNGRFASCYPVLHEDISWEIVGEKTIRGKEAVMENCRRTADYFRSVTTEFSTDTVLEQDGQVVVNGTAAFYREGKKLSVISASDWYHFNEKGELVAIRSWCIPLTN